MKQSKQTYVATSEPSEYNLTINTTKILTMDTDRHVSGR